MERLRQDIQLAFRGWRRRPLLAAVMVLTLSLGISATVVVFSIVDAVLLKPLPYAQSDRIAVVHARFPARQQSIDLLSGPELLALGERARSLAHIGAIWARPGVLRGREGSPVEIEVGWVTPGYFETLGVAPLLGRLPTPEEERVQGDVMVLSHALWQQRYGADPAIVGRRIDFDDEPRTVIGVMPRSFRMLFPAEQGVPDSLQAWLPWGPSLRELSRGFRVFTVTGRLADDVTWGEVAGELAALAGEISRESVDYAATGFELTARPLAEGLVAAVRPTLMVLLGVVGVVFLVACANVANLMLSRAEERSAELVLRRVLGASRSRLWRQLLTESALLGAAAGLAGVWLAAAGVSLLHGLAPAGLPRLHDVAIDARTLAAASGAALAAALALGSISTVYALSGSRLSSQPQASRSTSSPIGFARRALVAAQLSLSLVLLSGAGLLVRTFVSLSAVDLGFDPAGVVSARVSLPDVRYPYDTGGRDIAEFYRQLDERMSELPGVRAVGATLNPPLSGSPMRPRPYAYRTADGEVPWGSLVADYRTVTPGWFRAAGVRLVAGRFLDAHDRWDRPVAVVVDSALARSAWPGRDPLGQALRVELFREGVFTGHWGEVVGVVEPVRLNDLVASEREQVYIAHHQSPQRTMYPTIKTSGQPLAILPGLREAVAALESDLPVFDVRLAVEYVAAAMAQTRFALVSLGLFAAVALTLAAAGTYAAMAFSVARRRREIGIRLAVGAAPSAVLRLIVGQGLRLIATGVLGGLVGALALTRLLQGLLHGVSPTDPLTLGGVAALLTSVAAAACWVPARRAAGVDPAEALRAE